MEGGEVTNTGKFKLQVVQNEAEAMEFLHLPLKLYKGDPNFIRPLDDDINKVFDQKKNRMFRKGELIRWILKDSKGETVGRVAAFYTRDASKGNKQPTGGMGFYECIDDREASVVLFDACKNWLIENGMEAMDGPINFGEKDSWWGLLVDGFTHPVYQMNYNHPYYQEQFESYGFQLYFRQYSYGMKVNDDRPAKYFERADRINADPDYEFRHIDKNNLEKGAEDFMKVYNGAFHKIPAFKPMSKAQCMKIMKSIKPILVDYLMWFGYYKGEPIAMYLSIPEVNQWFRFVNGKMNWLGKLKFAYHRWRHTGNKFLSIVFGVVTEQQAKGVEGALIMAANNHIQPMKEWEYIELKWIGDFNPKMMRVAENLGATIDKTHITYRMLFDPNAPFERAKIKK